MYYNSFTTFLRGDLHNVLSFYVNKKITREGYSRTRCRIMVNSCARRHVCLDLAKRTQPVNDLTPMTLSPDTVICTHCVYFESHGNR